MKAGIEVTVLYPSWTIPGNG